MLGSLKVLIFCALSLALLLFLGALRGVVTAPITATGFTLLALVASIASLGYQIWRTGLVQAADLLMRFEQNFFGSEKVKQRAQAARNNLQDPQNFTEMEDILDFFETVAMLTRKGALDLYMVWHTFDYWIERYFAIAAPYITLRQQEEPGVWEDLAWLVPKLEKLRTRKNRTTGKLNHGVQKAFLEEEASEN